MFAVRTPVGLPKVGERLHMTEHDEHVFELRGKYRMNKLAQSIATEKERRMS
jgi:hypothetical protein